MYLYNIDMKISEMPEWALKYKTKGYTLRQVGNHYALYKATSKYVKGGNPKTILTFVGMITEEDGLIPKKTKPESSIVYIEYGLSHFIYTFFKRTLQRSIFNSTGDNDLLIRLAIIQYIFGNTYLSSISCSFISKDIEEKMVALSKTISASRIINLSKKIDKELQNLIVDEEERCTLINLLRLVVVNKESSANELQIYYSDEIIKILKKYEVHYEKM